MQYVYTYYKRHWDYTFEELKANYDLLFERLDYVAYIGFVGGEPFLNPAVKDRKFYYCNVSWSAEKCGRYTLSKEDYIALDEIDPKDKKACHRLVELSRGTSSFCRVCGGCGSDNHNYVPIGVQMKGVVNAKGDKISN